jgi:hypothetical protein
MTDAFVLGGVLGVCVGSGQGVALVWRTPSA